MDRNLFDIDTALITSRTVTRRFRENDGVAFYELFQDNFSVLEDLFPDWTDQIKSETDAEQWARTQLAEWLRLESFSFSIWEKGPVSLIGWIALQQFRPDWGDAHLTGFIDQKHTKKGIMTEVLVALLDFAFDELKLEKVKLTLAADNYPAQRLARKCQFTREGDLRLEGRKRTGERFDQVIFGFTKVDYEGNIS